MIIIPELEKVVLQPPRTGTTSLRDAVLETYPKAFLIYRHMEAAGIPEGYSEWDRVVQVRNPLSRLISLYRYMKNPVVKPRACTNWIKAVKRSTENGFEAWLENDTVFCQAYSTGKLRPRDLTRYCIPEQKKSQFLWVMPGTGKVDLIHNERIANEALDILGVEVKHKNKSLCPGEFSFNPSVVEEHLRKYFIWDVQYYGGIDDVFANHAY